MAITEILTGHDTTTEKGWLRLLLGLAGLWGLAAWSYELANGLAVTGMRDVVSWGMYIFSFAFFIGLAAGGLIVASAAEVFGIQSLKILSRLGVLSALACVTVAALLVIPDLGKPQRILNIIIHPNWTSPLVWDLTIIAIYFTFAAVDLFVLTRSANNRGSWYKPVRALAFIGLPLAVLLHSVTAWIFGLQISRTYWNTALLAPLFVVSAILSGAALVVVLVLIVSRVDTIEIPSSTWGWMRGILAVSLATDLFFVGSEYVTTIWGNVPQARASLDVILPGGSWSWLFWTEWIVGGVIPFLFLVTPRLKKLPGSLGVASVLIMVGVYAFRIELVAAGFVKPLLPFPPGIAIGTFKSGVSSFQVPGTYSPTWVEYGIVVGLLALFIGIITYGYRHLHPLQDATDVSV